MADTTTIARPYAKAAFEVAVAANTISKWADFLSVLKIATQEPAVISLLNDPRLTHEALLELFLSVTKAQSFAEGENFLRLLAEKNRLDVLPEIDALFEDFRMHHEKVISVNITSAFAMTDKLVEQFKKALHSRLEKRIELTVDVNELLLGGAIVRAGDMVIDGSVKTHLDRLYHQLCLE